MPKLRKRRRVQKFRHNINRKRMRNSQYSTGNIKSDEIKKVWEDNKSVRTNLEEMGLCYDPNQTFPLIKKAKKKKGNTETVQEGPWTVETEVNPNKANVAAELLKDAKAPRARQFKLPKSIVERLTYYLDKYGCDFKAMVRDKKNYNQETWKQIRNKIKLFFSVPEQGGKYLQTASDAVKSMRFDESDDEI